MLVSDVRTRIINQFGDLNQAQITDASVLNWVNDAIKEVVVQNNLSQTQGTTPSVAGTIEYSIPADCVRLRRVAYAGYALRPISVEEADELMGAVGLGHNGISSAALPSGTPTHYWVWAGKINLFPMPSASGDTITIYYNSMPAALTSTGNTIPTPAEYDNRIVEYCLAQAFELDMNTTMMQVKSGQFQQGIDKLKGQADWENQEFYPNITSFQEYPDDIVGSSY